MASMRELDDAFAYGNFHAGANAGCPCGPGAKTLLGGEKAASSTPIPSRAAMAPTDYLKTMTDQDGYSGNLFLPVAQVRSDTSATVLVFRLSFLQSVSNGRGVPSNWGDGSFLSYLDYVGAGGGPGSF